MQTVHVAPIHQVWGGHSQLGGVEEADEDKYLRGALLHMQQQIVQARQLAGGQTLLGTSTLVDSALT